MCKESYFSELNAINVNEHTEKKNDLTYLSWAWAWQKIKMHYPMSYYTIYEDVRGLNYFTDGKTGYVKTGVTVVFDDGNKIEHIEYLPIMDIRNKSIPSDNITSFDVNKAIQRSLTKACARHGLGLYIYAGEDLPDDDSDEPKPPKTAPKTSRAEAAKKADAEADAELDKAFAPEMTYNSALEVRYEGQTLREIYQLYRRKQPDKIAEIRDNADSNVQTAIDCIEKFLKERKQ